MMKDSTNQFPANGFVYDYFYNMEKKEWIIWTETVQKYQCDSKMNYGEIVVPTFDSIRMLYLKKLLIMNNKHILCPGPTGTGKTVNINQLLT